nr:type I restriction enzyme endonuclease domain-containing protein [Microbulbifer sp. GX H0434]
MKKALRDYAQGEDGSEPPVQEKSELFRLLDDAIAQTNAWCREQDIHLAAILETDNTFQNISLFEQYADILLGSDALRKTFYVYDNTVSSLYEACKPEVLSQKPRPLIAVIQYLRGVIDMHLEQVDIDQVTEKISELLDESMVVENADKFLVKEHQAEYQIVQKGRTWDLSRLNFDKLREEFKDAQYKNIEIAELKAFIEDKLRQMMQQNHTRTDFALKLQEIVDRYNAGGSSTENYFEDLMKFAESMQQEDERHVREGLSEDELELFDLLKKDKLTKKEEQRVKLAAKDLIVSLLQAHPKVLVQDWWKDGQTRQRVKAEIEKVLDQDLPDSYGRVEFKEKCDKVFDLVVEFAAHKMKWAA